MEEVGLKMVCVCVCVCGEDEVEGVTLFVLLFYWSEKFTNINLL